MYFLFVFSWRDLWNMCTFILIRSLAYMGCTWCRCLYHHGYWVVLGWLGCCLQVSIFLTSKVIIERLYVLERKHYWHWLSQILTAPWTLLTKHFTTSLFTSWYSGFSLTFEVEGHCLVNRRVPCKIEGRRPEPLGGSGGMLPREIFKTQVFQKRIFLQSGKEILLWRILTLIIVKKNDTLGEFVYFTIQL